MDNGLKLLNAVFEQLRTLGAVQTKAQFSTAYLGKAPSYMTSMQARDRQVSDDVLATLEAALLIETHAQHYGRADNAYTAVVRRLHAQVELHRAERWLRALEDEAEYPLPEEPAAIPARKPKADRGVFNVQAAIHWLAGFTPHKA